jgi:formate dehydrogenase major subunit
MPVTQPSAWQRSYNRFNAEQESFASDLRIPQDDNLAPAK